MLTMGYFIAGFMLYGMLGGLAFVCIGNSWIAIPHIKNWLRLRKIAKQTRGVREGWETDMSDEEREALLKEMRKTKHI